MTRSISEKCIVFLLLVLTLPIAAQKKCFTADAKALAQRSAVVWHQPDPGYNPVLGYNPDAGPRLGAPPVDENGLAKPVACVANIKEEKGSGTTPKFYCSVPDLKDKDGELIRYKVKPQFKGAQKEKRNGEIYGEFLSSRFSKALGFFADDEWVADVTCPDCEKSLTAKFQGATFNQFQPAAGIELPIGKGIDVDCDNNDTGSLEDSLENLLKNGGSRAEIDAFKLWLAFIDHGDTKTDNQKFSCLKWTKNADNTLACEQGQMIYYVSDMGSTFGSAKSSENKTRLAEWRKREDPIEVKDGRCSATPKSAGDNSITEGGRKLLSDELQGLLDAQRTSGLITAVFRASRNQERDEAPEAWTAEFIRRARTIINARCSK